MNIPSTIDSPDARERPQRHSTFFAHSTADPSKADWQPLASHLRNVGEAARERAAFFNAGELAEVAGLLHDVGKYTDEFQRRIAGDSIRVDHATRGAILSSERFGPVGGLLAYAIAGHHAGLANGAEPRERSALRQRLLGRGLPSLIDRWREEISLPERLAMPPLKLHSRERGMFQSAFLIRMLFSCLVDADYLDTAAFYDRVEGRVSPQALATPSLDVLREQLDRYLTRFKPDSDVNVIRADILRHVRLQAARDPGLFSLSVPTGGGKTLASLAFALDHALRFGLRRIIFVIPFTSIVEQNAAVFREALGPFGDGAVLEHHSAFTAAPPPPGEPDHYQAKEKLRLAMENWDAPVVVTTAVQFFESLFAARPAQCRKLHNISGSVVILDEAQTLPIGRLRPIVATIDELARNYRCSIVMCTATQPALQAPSFRGGFEAVRELAPDPPALFEQLKRVRVRHLGALNDVELSAQLRERPQVLCIVNNRRHARAVYQTIADLPGSRHLTTLMCARHRSAVLNDIRLRLRRGEPCRIVSTSLIEAGVDISVPTVFRAEAGLDAIAQAAGRCNRHGERPTEASDVLVFATSNDDWAPPPELRQFAQAARETLRSHSDPLSPAAIEAYFRHLYWQKGENELDASDLLGRLRESRIDSLPLEDLAAEFRMIGIRQTPVIVPFDTDALDAVERLEFADRAGVLARRLQPYLVQVPRHAADLLQNAGAVQPIAPQRWGEQFLLLANMDLYDAQFGLSWDDPTFVQAATLMW